MGKRRRNERQTLGNAAGPENLHYCEVHNQICTPIQVWPKKVMHWACKEGCKLYKEQTILKARPAPKRK